MRLDTTMSIEADCDLSRNSQNKRETIMITVDKLSAILQYKINAKSRNSVTRLTANAKANEFALLDKEKKLKPEYETLFKAIVALHKAGEPIEDVINIAQVNFVEVDQTADYIYRKLIQ